MGGREIFHTFLLLVAIEGHFTHEFIIYVYETRDRSQIVRHKNGDVLTQVSGKQRPGDVTVVTSLGHMISFRGRNVL
jgi:hypothetical protein